MAQICLEMGFQSVDSYALNILTDVVFQCITLLDLEDIALQCAKCSTLSSRTESNLIDLLIVLHTSGITKQTLLKHMKDNHLHTKFVLESTLINRALWIIRQSHKRAQPI